MFQKELNKHDNKVGVSQSIQEIQSHMSLKNVIYSQVKGTEKKRRVFYEKDLKTQKIESYFI